MIKRRFGHFEYTAELIESGYAEQLFKILQFCPIKVEHLYHKDVFECFGYSPLFKEIGEGDTATEYVVELKRRTEEDGCQYVTDIELIDMSAARQEDRIRTMIDVNRREVETA